MKRFTVLQKEAHQITLTLAPLRHVLLSRTPETGISLFPRIGFLIQCPIIHTQKRPTANPVVHSKPLHRF